MQERVDTGSYMACIEHRPIDRFIINTHAFHNAHLLRSTLPHSLISPIPLHRSEDRYAMHVRSAEALRTLKANKAAAKAASEETKKTDRAAKGSSRNKRTRTEMEVEIG